MSRFAVHSLQRIEPHRFLGKSKGGLTNGGLSPKFSEKIGGKSFLGNRAFSGLIGSFSGPIGAFSGPIGTDSSAPHRHGGRGEIAPKGPFLAQLAPFGPSPRLLSPPLDFPEIRSDLKSHDSNRNPEFFSIRCDVFTLFFKYVWESAKVSHKRVFALLTPEIHSYEMAQMLQKPVFALPGCQRTSVNTLLCDTLALAENCAIRFARFGSLADPDSNRTHRDI